MDLLRESHLLRHRLLTHDFGRQISPAFRTSYASCTPQPIKERLSLRLAEKSARVT
jgi:hypothetical protein